jgi:hypothetical protein
MLLIGAATRYPTTRRAESSNGTGAKRNPKVVPERRAGRLYRGPRGPAERLPMPAPAEISRQRAALLRLPRAKEQVVSPAVTRIAPSAEGCLAGKSAVLQVW